MKPLFASIPHSGLKIPPQADWLKGLPDSILLCDPDLFVDRLYGPALEEFQIPFFAAPFHRYAADASRFPEDVSPLVVKGAKPSPSKSPSHIHWHKTTKGELLIKKPISWQTHRELLRLCFEPFHKKIRDQFALLRQKGLSDALLLDLHSMPSTGRLFHKDPGQKRRDIVLGDLEGAAAAKGFHDLAEEAFRRAGFDTIWNWPYKGGGMAQAYGRPAKGRHVIQIELNRALYMDEETKRKSKNFPEIQSKLKAALAFIEREIPSALRRL